MDIEGREDAVEIARVCRRIYILFSLVHLPPVRVSYAPWQCGAEEKPDIWFAASNRASDILSRPPAHVQVATPQKPSLKRRKYCKTSQSGAVLIES